MANDLKIIFDLLTGKDTVNPVLKDAQKNTTSLESSLKNIPKSFSGIGASVSSFASSIPGLGIALGAVAGAFSFGKIINEGIEAEKSVSQLNIALKSAGLYSEQTSKRFQELASSIQETTTFTDDAVMGVEGLLANLTKLNADGIEKATKATVDFAAAMGISLETAATVVGKSIANSTSALSRYGLKTKDAKTETERFANVLETLSKFQGAADAQALTFGGSMTKLSNNFGEFLESLGTAIIKTPEFANLLTSVSNQIIELTKSLNNSSSSVNSFIDIAKTGLSWMLKVISVTSDAISMIYKVFQTTGLAILSTTSAFAMGIGKLIDMLPKSIKEKLGLEETAQNLTAIFEASVDAMKKSFKETGEILVNSNTWDKFDKALNTPINKAKENLSTLNKSAPKEIKIIPVFDTYQLESTLGRLNGQAIEFKTTFGEFVLDPLNKSSEDAKEFKKVWSSEVLSTMGMTASVANESSKSVNNFNFTMENVSLYADEATDGVFKLSASLADIKNQTAEFSGRFSTSIGSVFESFTLVKDSINGMFNYLPNAVTLAVGSMLSSITTLVSKGKEGARQLVSGLGAAAADALVPGLGKAVGPILDVLSQGPEAVKKMAEEFTKAIPDIIQSIIEAAPVLIDGLVTGLVDALVVLSEKVDVIIERFITAFIKSTPRIIEALVAAIPRIAVALGNSLIALLPNVIANVIYDLGNGIYSIFTSVGEYLIEAIKSVVDFLNPTSGEFLGLAKGGIPSVKSVPTGYNNDTFPASLTSGELVVDRSTTARLQEFLDKPQGSTSGDVLAIMAEILAEVRRPISVETSVNFRDNVLADIILDLNRRNVRLA